MHETYSNPATFSAVPPDNSRRFGGVIRLYGATGAERIFQAHVVVVGIGGVGSWAAEALARSGVGRLTLIDLDHVAESNINRQIHACDATLGQAKVEAMRTRIASYSPHCQVHVIDDFVTSENWAQLVPAGCSAVIDACDQRSAKWAMSAWALAQPVAQRPLFVTAGAAGGKRLGHCVEVADLAHVTHDPLLARLRQQLRKQQRQLSMPAAPQPAAALASSAGVTRTSAAATSAGTTTTMQTIHQQRKSKSAIPARMGITCVFSREPVQAPADASSCDMGAAGLSCHGYGSAMSVTAVFGLSAAGWVLDKLAAGAS